MKLLKYITLCVLALSCSSTELVDTWKNPDIDSYSPKKVLLMGLTSNIEARKMFEEQLKQEYNSRGIEAVLGSEFIKSAFSTEKKSEEELQALENYLLDNGFDTILLAKVIGVEDKIEYKENFKGYDNTYIKFKEDYLKYQDAYYNPDYYNEYKIYHSEMSLFCICPSKDRELIWKGYIDVTDPISIEETINDYVKLVILVLEEEQLINPLIIEEIKDEQTIN